MIAFSLSFRQLLFSRLAAQDKISASAERGRTTTTTYYYYPQHEMRTVQTPKSLQTKKVLLVHVYCESSLHSVLSRQFRSKLGAKKKDWVKYPSPRNIQDPGNSWVKQPSHQSSAGLAPGFPFCTNNPRTLISFSMFCFSSPCRESHRLKRLKVQATWIPQRNWPL